MFCASLADVFEDWQGNITGSGQQKDAPGELAIDDKRTRLATMDDMRRELFALIDATPNLDWLLLTKRPENIRRMWPTPINAHGYGSPEQIVRYDRLRRVYGRDYHKMDLARPNVWLGTSVTEQESADKNSPELLKCRELSPVLFLSCEPLLGPVDLQHGPVGAWIPSSDGFVSCGSSGDPIHVSDGGRGIDWVIVGGESGHSARPMHPQWAESIRDQCQAARVAYHFKQWGELAPVRLFRTWPKYRDQMKDYASVCDVLLNADGTIPTNGSENGKVWPLAVMKRVGKKKAGRLLDGREWNEFPVVTP